MSDNPVNASAPLLPAEVTDIIVDFLHDDYQSLANCSLVCKQWLPVARYHLLGRLYLHSGNTKFFKKLITGRRAIRHIHYVIIDRVRSRHTRFFDAMYLHFRPFDFVRRLEFRGIGLHLYPSSSIGRLVSTFQGVTNMRLDNCHFTAPPHLWRLVSSFPLLQRLSVTNPEFSHNTTSLDHGLDISTILPPPKIRDLVLSEISLHPTHILNWFSSHRVLVDSLSVHLGRFAVSSLNGYLQVLGPSLLCFTMELWAGLEETFLSQLDLSFNTSLRKLRFSSFRFKLRDALSSTIPSMFARISSSCLNEIEFTNIPDPRHFLWELEDDATSTTPSSSMWRALDDVLSGFSSLRAIRFALSPRHSEPLAFVGYVRRGLSSCHARGLLSFKQVIDKHVRTL